jgi:diaminopimelate decarboxylase
MQVRVHAIDVASLHLASQLIQKYGSPLYVYRQDIIHKKIDTLLQAARGFGISYALKANTNSTLVKIIRERGITHVDVVSPG